MTAKKLPARAYVASRLQQDLTAVDGYGRESSVSLACDDMGCIGALPVYRTKTAARAAHGKDVDLIPINIPVTE